MAWGIRKKLIVFLLLATILPFGIAIGITYMETTSALNDRSVKTNHDLIVKGKEELSVYLQDIAQMSTVLYRQTPFISVMRDGVSANLMVNEQEVRTALAYLSNTRPEIEQMHLYIDKDKDSYTIYHSRRSGRGKYENILSNPFYAQLVRQDQFFVIEPPHDIYSYNNLSVIPTSEKIKVLSFHNIIRDVPLKDTLGFLSIDIDLSRISAIADRLYTKDVEELYIMNEQDVVVYSSDHNLIGKNLTEKWYRQVQDLSYTEKSMEWTDPTFSGVIVYDRFSDPLQKWYIVKRIPYNVLYESARDSAQMNGTVGIVTLFVVLIATMIISFKITAPIKVLIENMKIVEKGEFRADFDTLGNDEIGMLGNHFKLMVAKINELIEREYRLDIENKASQLRVLRSQINPHFLYNTLQSIGTEALKLKAVQVYKLLTSLSSIMRYSMNVKEDVVPFSAELKHAESYLHLQKQRFHDHFEYTLKIDAEMEDVYVPKMILQPLVENCFKHGFDQQIEAASITIRAYVDSVGIVHILVADSGVGVSGDRLEQIRELLYVGTRKENIESESIGLKNIYDRLQIYYGQRARMIVSSGKGFVVNIEIPSEMPIEVSMDESANSR